MSVVVIATGGTIASLTDPTTEMVQQAVTAAALLDTVPALRQFGDDIDVVDVCRVSGWNMTPELMLVVARGVRQALSQPSVDGVVVTHGTDTAEEMAFLLDILTGSDKPVVLACALRSGDEVSADGPRNLLNAFITARGEGLRGYGTLVCMNDELHAARWVTKSDSYRAGAFTSPDQGAIGSVTPVRGAVPLRGRLNRWNSELPERLSHVPIIRTYTGMTGEGLPGLLSRAEGVVFEGSGLGNLPGGVQDTVTSCLDAGVPVVVATRVPTGGTHPVYGGLGGGATLRDLGASFAGRLTPGKARLLLATILAVAPDRAVGTFREAVRVLQ